MVKKELKPCPPGKKINPLTNRCKKSTEKSEKKVKKPIKPLTKKVKKPIKPLTKKVKKPIKPLTKKVKKPIKPLTKKVKKPITKTTKRCMEWKGKPLPPLSKPSTSYIEFDLPLPHKQGLQHDADEKCSFSPEQILKINQAWFPKGKGLNKKDKPCDVINKFFDTRCIPDTIRITTFIGTGADGLILGTIDTKTNKKGVLKITRQEQIKSLKKIGVGRSKITHEIKLGKDFYRMGLGPKIHWQCSFKSKINTNEYFDVYHMERVDGSLAELLGRWTYPSMNKKYVKIVAKHVAKLLCRLYENGYTHGDFHQSNIVYRFVNNSSKVRLMILDGNRSSSKIAIPTLDIFVLAYQLLGILAEDRYSSNDLILAFISQFRKESEKAFGVVFDVDLSQEYIIILQEITFELLDFIGSPQDDELYLGFGTSKRDISVLKKNKIPYTNSPFTRHDI